MRGKLPDVLAELIHVVHASMRPAHYAREVPLEGVVAGALPVASMRPAHYAREVQARRMGAVAGRAASMRPAHYAREVADRRAK